MQFDQVMQFRRGKKAFNIQDNYWIPRLLASGYFDAKQSLAPPKWRKSVDEIVVRFD